LSSIHLMFQDTACFLGSIHWQSRLPTV
jgi:hypothetical protein